MESVHELKTYVIWKILETNFEGREIMEAILL